MSLTKATYSMIEGAPVNILDFGAVGDGVTDCTSAIQAALDTKRAVFIPEGSYLVSSTLFYYSTQRVFGLGDKSEIKSTISGSNVLENAERIFNTNLHDFRIAGSGNETGGIRVTEGFEGMRLSRIIVSTVGGKAFWFSNIFVVDCYDLWAEGNNTTEFGLHLDNTNNFNFYGCHFRESKKEGAGARVIRGSFSNYVINFHGCIFESNYGDGLQLQGANAVTVDGCYFEANAREYQNDNTFRANHVSVKDFDGLGTAGGEYITIKNSYFNPNYVEHLVQTTVDVTPISLENNLDQNFGIYPHQTVRYDLDLSTSSLCRAQLIGLSPVNVDTHGDNESLSATNYRSPDQSPVRLVYFNSAGTAIEGDVSATITSTRTMQGGSVKVCTFEIDSIDTSGIDANRLIAVVPPVNRFSVGPFTANLEHSGTSATGVLQFSLESSTTTLSFLLRKLRSTASGSKVGRAGDLVGVSELKGSIVYF